MLNMGEQNIQLEIHLNLEDVDRKTAEQIIQEVSKTLADNSRLQEMNISVPIHAGIIEILFLFGMPILQHFVGGMAEELGKDLYRKIKEAYHSYNVRHGVQGYFIVRIHDAAFEEKYPFHGENDFTNTLDMIISQLEGYFPEEK